MGRRHEETLHQRECTDPYKPLKRRSASLALREMHIKSTMRHNTTAHLLEWPNKKLTTPSIGGVQSNCSCHALPEEVQNAVPGSVGQGISYHMARSPTGVSVPEKRRCRFTQKPSVNVYSRSRHSLQNPATTDMFIRRWERQTPDDHVIVASVPGHYSAGKRATLLLHVTTCRVLGSLLCAWPVSGYIVCRCLC